MIHPYEHLQDAFRDVVAWKPLDCAVKFTEGRAFLDQPSGTDAGNLDMRGINCLRVRVLDTSTMTTLNPYGFINAGDHKKFLEMAEKNQEGKVRVTHG